MAISETVFADFKYFAQGHPCCPLVRPLEFFADPLVVYRAFKNEKTPSVLLESSRSSHKTGRYSFIGRNPSLILEAKGSEITLSSFGVREVLHGNPFETLQRILDLYSAASQPGLPPYIGGAVGYFGYEAKNYLEPTLRQSLKESQGLPDVYFLFFNEGIILDHERQATFIFAHVKVGKDLRKSFNHAVKELNTLENDLKRVRSARPASLQKRFSDAGRIFDPRFYFEDETRKAERGDPPFESSLRAILFHGHFRDGVCGF